MRPDIVCEVIQQNSCCLLSNSLAKRNNKNQRYGQTNISEKTISELVQETELIAIPDFLPVVNYLKQLKLLKPASCRDCFLL